MPYIVSARKYRPQTFEELVGQEHIASTLRNAIVKGRVGHAYLFSGPRGIGKTSAARIFAKALNCEKGPTPEPCGSCVFCTEITEGRSLDLVEIDGASNRRIDEVRQLRENVRFVPSAARYKIYIIDEVHMLTTEAFNALLKTLEEPPEHIIFVFATTEQNKVPQTIRSRCQQFIFRRIPIPLIVEVLRRIIGDFGIEAEERALFWIAKSASGSMRDAESILDQMTSYSESTIKEADVFYVLGLPDYDIYHRFARFIAEEDFKGSCELLDRLIRGGIEVSTLASGMIEYFRNLYVLSVDESSIDLIDLPPEDVQEMKVLLPRFRRNDIGNILSLLSKTFLDVRNSELGRELFEITMIKMVRFRDIIEPAQLAGRLEELRTEVLGRGKEQGTIGQPGAVARVNPGAGSNRQVVEPPEVSGMGPASGTIEGNPAAALQESGIVTKITQHLSVKRRALAEFLMRAKNVSLENNVLTVTCGQNEKLSYEHLSESSAKRYIEREIGNFLQRDIHLNVVIEKEEVELHTAAMPSEDVSRVLEIFKGEVVPDNDADV